MVSLLASPRLASPVDADAEMRRIVQPASKKAQGEADGWRRSGQVKRVRTIGNVLPREEWRDCAAVVVVVVVVVVDVGWQRLVFVVMKERLERCSSLGSGNDHRAMAAFPGAIVRRRQMAERVAVPSRRRSVDVVVSGRS
jgi:hypothetical protein